MKSRPNPRFVRTEFASFTGAPPYTVTGMRARKGLNRTVFFPTIGKFATDYKLHNTYLKPDFITDPLEEYWTMRKVAGLWDVTGEEIIEIKGKDAEAPARRSDAARCQEDEGRTRLLLGALLRFWRHRRGRHPGPL